MEMLKYTLGGILFGLISLLNPASAQEAQRGETKVEVNIEITDDGGGETIFLNGKQVFASELEEHLNSPEFGMEWTDEDAAIVKEMEWIGSLEEMNWSDIWAEFSLLAFKPGTEEVSLEVMELFNGEIAELLKSTEEGIEISVDRDKIFIPGEEKDDE
jgi:hypothetical protein